LSVPAFCLTGQSAGFEWRAGTTFRKLPERDKQVDGSDAASAILLAQPSMIKHQTAGAGTRWRSAGRLQA